MRCLLVYYSFTSQAARAADHLAHQLKLKKCETVCCRIDFADETCRLRRPLSLSDLRRWTTAAAAGDTLAMVLDPPDALDAEYDLIFILSNTWHNHPCVPIRSLLADGKFQATLRGKPFGVLVVCRGAWRRNLAIVTRLGEAAGGQLVATETLTHRGGAVGSFIQNLIYMMRTDEGRHRFLGFALPAFGLSEESLGRIAPFGARAIGRVRATRTS